MITGMIIKQAAKLSTKRASRKVAKVAASKAAKAEMRTLARQVMKEVKHGPGPRTNRSMLRLSLAQRAALKKAQKASAAARRKR